jgi:hypothetical protein
MKLAKGLSIRSVPSLLRLASVALSATVVFFIALAAHQGLMGSLLVSFLSIPPALEVIERYIEQKNESRD